MSNIFDNIHVSFEKGLRNLLSLPGVKRADFCVGYFNLRGWSSVADKVAVLPGDQVLEANYMGKSEWVPRTCRVLVGMNKSPSDLIREIFNPTQPDNAYATRCRAAIVEDFRRQLLQVPPRSEDEASLTTLKAQLEDGRVTVKLHLRYPLHAKLYIAHRPEDTSNPIPSLMGSSNLTFGGLGGNGELDAEFGDPDDCQKFAQWFDERWNDAFSLDITEDLAKALEESWVSLRPTPWEIYLRMMYLLGGEARAGASEFKIPPPFDKKLYDFQASGVQLLLRHLQQRGGAMLGDVVGLGKTMSACAVAKWYEWQNGSSTLVLCPPNLRKMWNGYKFDYDMKMDVWSIAEQFNPDKLHPYKLVIIDESHNLRNREGARYARVLDLLKQIDRDVLLLTATPFNKDFGDIAAQLRLILDPNTDLGVRPEKAISALGGVQGFAQEFPNIPLSSIQAFEKSEFPEDWNELLRKYLVRRTRYFIKNTYAFADETNPARKYLVSKVDNSRNYFPDRIPKSIRFQTAPGDAFERICSEETMDAISDLRLPRYGLVKYLDTAATASASKADKDVFASLSRSGKRLIGFSRSMLCKRMDSSGVVFLQSVYEHALRNAVFLHALCNNLDLPIRAGLEFDAGWLETESAEGSLLMEFPFEPKVFAERGRNAYEAIPRTDTQIKWLPAKFFKNSLATDLKKDNKLLLSILERCGAWNPAEDSKADALEELLVKTHPAEKVLVFTQFSDTARYLCEELKRRGIDHVCVVDGDSDDLTEQVELFSPVSNTKKGDPLPPVEKQTRVLVATDTISEGQNLQDAHIVVNYDLPWAIIRLIQRVGRVDRIGQNNETVSCYSFFPQEGIDRIIGLVARLNARIANNATAVGSDEIFFEGNPQNLRDIFNEKAGILDEDIDGDVDMASFAYQAWISATKDNRNLRDRIVGLPDAVYSTKAADQGKPGGVVALVQAPDGTDSLIRVAEGGKVIPVPARALLEEIACSPNTPALPMRDDHHALVQVALSEAKPDDASVTEGILGSKQSPQYRLFNLVRIRLQEEAGSLFEADCRLLSNALFSRPLREEALRDFRRLFARGNTSADDIVNHALALHGADNLCVPATSTESAPADPRVRCSLGLA